MQKCKSSQNFVFSVVYQTMKVNHLLLCMGLWDFEVAVVQLSLFFEGQELCNGCVLLVPGLNAKYSNL